MDRIRPVRIGKITIGPGKPLALMAGPCAIESRAGALKHAKAIAKICKCLGIPYIFKSSYDKANRSSIRSYRGPGIDAGLLVLQAVKDETGLPVVTDIHTPEEAQKAAFVADVLQIPAFLCRQTDLLLAAGKTGRAVNVKKGQFVAPADMKNVAEKIASTGNENILLCERGTFFGYGALVNDMRAIPIMQGFGRPVVFDATHSVQQPGGLGHATGGDRRFVPVLAQAAVAAGADALFMEVHENPDKAPSDGPNMLRLKDLEPLLAKLLKIHAAVNR